MTLVKLLPCCMHVLFVITWLWFSIPKVTSQSNQAVSDTHYSECYNDDGDPQRCVPEFVNAAFNVKVDATSTCGKLKVTDYCIQSGAMGTFKICDKCDDRDPNRRHPASYLTDFNNNENATWWQSESMTLYENSHGMGQVNLTLRLQKAYDITYIRLKFHSPRPYSLAIYKRTSVSDSKNEDPNEVEDSWVSYQYYSSDCQDHYGLPDSNFIQGGNQTRPLCTSAFSNIFPTTGGIVAFSTLEGRPSAGNIENSKELQQWVTATDIRVTLDSLNFFSDDIFVDWKKSRFYFYAITDFTVGGRCKCNGHASECVTSPNINGSSRLVCSCKHNTAGPDCGECLPFYNDFPWNRASSLDAHECQRCNCNGFSDRCYFDSKMYEKTGHGGHCTDCNGNRDGPNCERCKPNFYQRFDGQCFPCRCNKNAIIKWTWYFRFNQPSVQCDIDGSCHCKPDVTGEKCDRCQTNFYDFGQEGCNYGTGAGHAENNIAHIINHFTQAFLALIM